jgi:hypothetical protein
MEWIANPHQGLRSINYIHSPGGHSWIETKITGLTPAAEYDLSFWTLNSSDADAAHSALTVGVGIGPALTVPPATFVPFLSQTFSNTIPRPYPGYPFPWQQHVLHFAAPSAQVILHLEGPYDTYNHNAPNGGFWYLAYVDDFAITEVAPAPANSELSVQKIVNVVGTAPPPPPTSFAIDVTCSPSGTAQHLVFNYSSGAIPTETVPNLHDGAQCHIAEQPLPNAPVPTKNCRSGFAGWGPVQYPNGQNTVIDGTSVGTLELTAVNTFQCVPDTHGRLQIRKIVSPDDLHIGSTINFTATATCANPASSHVVNVAGGSASAAIDLPAESKCTISEAPPQPYVHGNMTCTWNAPVYSAQPFIIGANSGTMAVITNSYKCSVSATPLPGPVRPLDRVGSVARPIPPTPYQSGRSK